MNQLVKVNVGSEIRNNPKEISKLIINLAEDIEACKGDLTKIKNRSFFKKIFSSNTADLADMMIKQNDTISLFLNIVQSLIMFNMHNLVMLGEIQKELCKHEKSKGTYQNKYVQMAKEYITESYNAAFAVKRKIEYQEENLEQIKVDLINKNKLDMEQSQQISQLKSEIWSLDKTYNEQATVIRNLREELSKKGSIDTKQSKIIIGLHRQLEKNDRLDNLQNQLIKKIETVVLNLEEQINELNKKSENYRDDLMFANLKHGKQNKNILIGSISYGLVSLVAIIFLLFRVL